MARFRNPRVLFALVIGIALSACGDPVLVVVPPVSLQDMVETSPCDVLPEASPRRIGAYAHPFGYPRWVAGQATYSDEARGRRETGHMRPDPIVVQALRGGDRFENEVHDCQRLVLADGDGLTFGPLVGLFPFDPNMDATETDFDGEAGLMVATVLNWGGLSKEAKPYEPLLIQDGWNCLWLRRNGGDWQAGITHGVEKRCEDHSPPDDYRLDVQRALHNGAESDSIPETARWGWDTAGSVHTMGVKCGGAWCWVAPEDYWGEASTIVLTGEARSAIPGYFDEQHLAVDDGDGGIEPGPWGRVVPTLTFFLKAMEQNANPDDDILGPLFQDGIDVAELVISNRVGWDEGADLYSNKTGMSPAGGAATIRVALDTGTGAVYEPADKPAGNVERMTGGSHAPIGAVRWRWHDTLGSESTWSACGEKGQDCCDIN